MRRASLSAALACAALVAVAVVAHVSPASRVRAQGGTFRPPPSGEVSGVELALEGQASGPRGGEVTWLLTTYEVVGLSGLRPAPGALVRVVSALSPGEPVVEATSDAHGRLEVRVPIPEDAPSSFGVSMLVRARSGVQRRFELSVEATEPWSLALEVAPRAVRPGSRVAAFGRLADARSGRAVAGAEVELVLADGRGIAGPAVRARTDASGVFHHRFVVPDDATRDGGVRVTARALDPEHASSAAAVVAVLGPPAPALNVALAPVERVVRGGGVVQVDVVVRRGDGRPVHDAELTPSSRREGDPPPPRTDRRGRARVAIRVPAASGPYQDVDVTVDAVATGVGRGRGTARIRVASQRHAAAAAVEGGALVPGVSGRLFAYVVGIDGTPLEGADVVLDGPRLGDARTARTDASGVARFDVRLASGEGDDDCGGAGAVRARLTVREGGEASAIAACVPVDLEAAARIRPGAPRALAGGTASFEVQRAPGVARAPVAVALFRLEGGVAHAIHQRVVEPGTDRVELPLPGGLTGRFLVRARPLVGRERQEVRGGIALFDVASAATLVSTAAIDPEEGVVRVRATGGGANARTTLALALPADDALALYLAARASDEPADSLREARLAAATPADAGAPAVLRAGRAVPLPEPESPDALGVLRDPWRARDRFVEGRLGLVFRAIEAHLEASAPAEMSEVAAIERGRYRFNEVLLRTLPPDELLGAQGATGLGGEPLTVRQLEALDPAFGFDAVARRVTRERLFRLLVALRDFVRENGLDLTWARRGDPGAWLEQLRGRELPTGDTLEPRHLTDGWGRPFVLRAAATPRFGRLAPVPGYELVSAGADGRVGTGDDLWDPTARVLPAGSLYAEAVGESQLVARLAGVELGRATLEVAREIFGVAPATFELDDEGGTPASLALDVPPPLPMRADPLALRRDAATTPSSLAVSGAIAGEGALALALPAAPRAYGVVVRTFAADGGASIAFDAATIGAPVLMLATLPARLRAAEEVVLPVDVTNVTDEPIACELVATGEGGVEARAGAPFALPPGESRRVPVRLVARGPGDGALTLEARVGGQAVDRARGRVAIDAGALPMRRRASGFARGDRAFVAELALPDGAGASEGRVSVFAATALADDPELAELLEAFPALEGWAAAMTGRPIDAELRARIERHLRAPSPSERGFAPLAFAAAIGAFAALEGDDAVPGTRAALVAQLASPAPFADPRGEAPGLLRARAALVAALASQGVTDRLDAPPVQRDALGAVLVEHLPPLRRALRDVPAEPTLLARASAALLLAHPRDAHGLAMLERALAALPAEPSALLPVPAEMDRDEALAGTLALAIAAHQAGREDEALRLLRASARHAGAMARGSGELAFWYLAAGAYGLFGGEAPAHVDVAIDGVTTRVALAHGRGSVALPPGTRSRRVRVTAPEGGGVIAVAERVYATPFEARAGGPLTLAIDGDVGRGEEPAALELTVQASEAVARPVVELQVPAGVSAEAVRAGLVAQAPVRDAAVREPGFVRIRLAPLAEGAAARISLPVDFGLMGSFVGLGAAAYPEPDPGRLTVLPPQRLVR